jgi:hypothetical protein
MTNDAKIGFDPLAMNRAIWTTALRLGEFNYASLAAECHIDMRRAALLIRGWRTTGLATFKEVGTKRRHVFMLTAAARQIDLPANLIVIEPVASAAENLWRTARQLRSFGPKDLAVHSTTPQVDVTEEDAARFCQMLLRGAYVRVLRKASFTRKGGTVVKTAPIYRMVRDTGPFPPVERRVAAIYDPNLGQFTHIAGGEA